MTKHRNECEYFRVLTTIRLDIETDKKLKETIKSLGIGQSTFIRQAIRDAVTAAGVVA